MSTCTPTPNAGEPWTSWRERPASPDDVCRALANGSTLKQWTQAYNFDYAEVAHWLLDNPTRAYNYERSLQIYAHYLRDEIIEIAADDSQDLLTDAKGKTTLNHAHFRRQGRQIEARKALIRQITTGKKPLKDQEPYADVEAEINKILTQPGPYDPKGTLKGYKPSQPSYDPGPPPLSAATRQLGVVPVLPPPNPNLNPTPNPPPIPSATHAVGMASTPSPSAGSASASGASISENAIGTDHISSMDQAGSPHPQLPIPVPLSVTPPITNREQPTTNDHAPRPVPMIRANGAPPQIDWYTLLGVRRVSTVLLLFWFCVSQFVLNLHASIHSLSAPIKESIHGELSFPIREIGEIRVCLHPWLNPLPPSGFQLPTSLGPRNPSETFRHSRAAPPRPVTRVT